MDLVEGGHRDTEDNYRYFDPKQIKSGGPSNTQNRPNFGDVIVFVVGGGNYMEYQNLVDCFSQSRKDTLIPGGGSSGASSAFGRAPQAGGLSGKKVTYGSTYLYNGTEFLTQLAKLGAESN